MTWLMPMQMAALKAAGGGANSEDEGDSDASAGDASSGECAEE